MIESYNIWIALTTTLKPPTGASKPFNASEVYRWTKKFREGRDFFHEQLVAEQAPIGSLDDIDCVTKESNGLCKVMQTTRHRGLFAWTGPQFRD